MLVTLYVPLQSDHKNLLLWFCCGNTSVLVDTIITGPRHDNADTSNSLRVCHTAGQLSYRNYLYDSKRLNIQAKCIILSKMHMQGDMRSPIDISRFAVRTFFLLYMLLVMRLTLECAK